MRETALVGTSDGVHQLDAIKTASLSRTAAATLIAAVAVLAIPVLIPAGPQTPTYVAIGGIGVLLASLLWSINAAAWFGATFLIALIVFFPSGCAYSSHGGFFGCSSLVGVSLFGRTGETPHGWILVAASLIATAATAIVARKTRRDPLWKLARP